MASEALSVSGVDAFYGDSHVLHGVGFALRAGRLLGLLGRNGAGKTTCMATIMGFLQPAARRDRAVRRAGRGPRARGDRAQGHLPRAAGPARVPLARRCGRT